MNKAAAAPPSDNSFPVVTSSEFQNGATAIRTAQRLILEQLQAQTASEQEAGLAVAQSTLPSQTVSNRDTHGVLPPSSHTLILSEEMVPLPSSQTATVLQPLSQPKLPPQQLQRAVQWIQNLLTPPQGANPLSVVGGGGGALSQAVSALSRSASLMTDPETLATPQTLDPPGPGGVGGSGSDVLRELADRRRVLERDAAYVEGLAKVYAGGEAFGPAWREGQVAYAESLQVWVWGFGMVCLRA